MSVTPGTKRSGRRQAWLKLLLGVLVVVLVAVTTANYSDQCGVWERSPPRLFTVSRALAPWRAGAAKVELPLPWPVTLAGYGPPRPTAGKAELPLYARAIAINAGGSNVAIVSLDVLLIPRAVGDEVRRQLGQQTVLVAATHTHSSAGGFDIRPLAQLAGTGNYRPEVQQALVKAAVDAVKLAQSSQVDVQVSLHQSANGPCLPRSGEQCDRDVSKLTLKGAQSVAELWLLSAHPTLAGRRPEQAHPDWPGVLAASREKNGAGIAVVLQSAAGNASADTGEDKSPAAFAAKLEQLPLVEAFAPSAEPQPLAFARAGVPLPHPDASRFAPALVRGAAQNLSCADADRDAEVSVLRLGPLSVVAIPAEPSHAAGLAFLNATRATRVLSLADSYLGYVEPKPVVDEGAGESKRQYFDASLLEELSGAATTAAFAAGTLSQ